MGDDPERARILARRDRFVAAALAAIGVAPGCGPRATEPVREPAPASEEQPARPAPVGTSRPAADAPDRGGEAAANGEPAHVPPEEGHTTPPTPPDPPIADLDADGVPDERDACPDVPGVDAVGSMRAGCPPRPCLTVLAPHEAHVNEKIYFPRGRSAVSAASRAVLDAVADVATRQELHVVIVGHSDSSEPEQIARDRAEAVRDYLVQRGVSPARLSSRSEGARQPADTNATPEGRAKNRRVEIEDARTPAP